MESNESKSLSPAQAEPVSADRRAFMKTMVAGTVVAGMTASVGKAEAATPVDICGGEVELPKGPSVVKVVFNQNKPPTVEMLQETIKELMGRSGCEGCGFVGILDFNERIIRELRFETAYLGKDANAITVVQDFAVGR